MKIKFNRHIFGILLILVLIVFILLLFQDKDFDKELLNKEIKINTIDIPISVYSHQITDWEYRQVNGENRFYGSFEIENIANPEFSNYILNWNITLPKEDWNWIFESVSGSLKPQEKISVNLSFIPPQPKGDYTTKIEVINKDNPDEKKPIYIYLTYGLVELYSQYNTLYMEVGETTTFECVFWVHSNRWEELNWKVYEISFGPGIIVSCNPNKGIIYPGDPPTAVGLTVIAFETGNYDGKIKVQRNNDPYDTGTVNITIVVL